MYFSRKKNIKIFLCIFLVFSLSSCTILPFDKQTEKKSKTFLAFSTAVTITIYDECDESIFAACRELCEKYELIFSRTNKESELYSLNEKRSLKVSDELLDLIKTGIYYSKLSGGAFDITIGSVSSIWDFTAESPAIPDPDILSDAVSHVGYKNILIDENIVTLLDPKLSIDLGAVAKGYIADKLKVFLIEQGIEHGIINLGGNILCIGSKTDNSDFSIGIQYPFKETQVNIATISVSDMSIVTSGTYERYFIDDGKLYHHILSPETGFPYENGLSAVTIISERSVDGDALSTVTFALGLEKGLEFINSLQDTYAIFITDDMKLYFSYGVEETFSVTK